MTRAPKELRMGAVGHGHFAPVLPALHHARSVDLAALVSGAPDKLAVLGHSPRGHAARTGHAISVTPVRTRHPQADQHIDVPPPSGTPTLVDVESAGKS